MKRIGELLDRSERNPSEPGGRSLGLEALVKVARTVAGALLGVSLVISCGQKGPLTLPEPGQAVAVPAAAAPELAPDDEEAEREQAGDDER